MICYPLYRHFPRLAVGVQSWKEKESVILSVGNSNFHAWLLKSIRKQVQLMLATPSAAREADTGIGRPPREGCTWYKYGANKCLYTRTWVVGCAEDLGYLPSNKTRSYSNYLRVSRLFSSIDPCAVVFSQTKREHASTRLPTTRTCTNK